MSPNEFQLRAALREGDGERVDPDAVLARAARLRHERRRRFVTVAGGLAAAAVVVGSASVFVAFSGDDGSGSKMQGAGNGTRSSATSVVRSSASSPSTTPQHSTPSKANVQCPASPERLMLPGGGGSGQFGSTGALFPSGVTTLDVCAYGAGSTSGAYRSRMTISAEITGVDATAIVAELNSAAATRVQTGKCPDNQTQEGGSARTLRLVGVTDGGTTSRPVLITVSCANTMATNGTAVRYLKSLPSALQDLLH